MPAGSQTFSFYIYTTRCFWKHFSQEIVVVVTEWQVREVVAFRRRCHFRLGLMCESLHVFTTLQVVIRLLFEVAAFFFFSPSMNSGLIRSYREVQVKLKLELTLYTIYKCIWRNNNITRYWTHKGESAGAIINSAPVKKEMWWKNNETVQSIDGRITCHCSKRSGVIKTIINSCLHTILVLPVPWPLVLYCGSLLININVNVVRHWT